VGTRSLAGGFTLNLGDFASYGFIAVAQPGTCRLEFQGRAESTAAGISADTSWQVSRAGRNLSQLYFRGTTARPIAPGPPVTQRPDSSSC
jgi:hypothetical protein